MRCRPAVLAILLVLAAGAPARAATKIVFGYTAVTEYASAFIAKDEGFFAAHGLDVDFVQMQLNSTEPAALVGDSLQLAVPTPSILLQANDGGLDLVILGNCSVSDPTADTGAILVRPGAGIATPQDLIGKRVGVPGLNALIHLMAREWLTLKGVDYNKVTFVETPFPQMGDLLRAGTVDAVVAVDPFYHRILAAGSGTVLARYMADLPAGIATSFYATTRAWADAHRDAVHGIQAALREANRFHRQHPEAWRPIVGRYIKLPPAVLATLRSPDLEFAVTPLQVDYWVDVMMRQGMLKRRPDVAALIVK